MAKLFKTPFAYQGTKEQLHDSAQPDGKASFAEGFTSAYTLDYGDADARDIAQAELNGIFHDITEAVGELQKYGVAVWQADMSPIAKYSLVFHDSKLWQAKKNTSATPAAGADWQQVDIADIVSQLGTLDLTNYATKTYVDNAVNGLASTSYVDSAVAPKATARVVNAQLAGKFDKTDVAQDSGQSTTKVMSQKAVTDAISDAAAGQLSWGGITGDIENQADLKAALDAALTKTFTPWQPEVIGGAGIDLPNVIDLFNSSDPITLTGSTVRMERTGFPSAEVPHLINGLKSDSINLGDTTSLYYKVKSSLDVDEVLSPTYAGFANSAGDYWAMPNVLISGGLLLLHGIGELMGSGDITEFSTPIEVLVTNDSEYCFSYDKSLNKVTFFVDGVEIASHSFTNDFGFDVVTGSVYIGADNYQGDPSTLTLWGETEFLSNPIYPIAGLEPLIIGAGGYVIDETKYPENPEGKGYEIVDLAQPTQWSALGREVKNGDFIVFDNAGMPKEVGGGGEADLSEYTKRTADETITGDWDFQGEMKVGDYTYNTMYGSYPVEKIITYAHPSLSSPMNIAYGINAGNTFASMTLAFNISDLGLGKSIVTDLFTEESSITGGSARVRSVTGKTIDGTVTKGMYIEAGAAGGVNTAIGVVSRSNGSSSLYFETGNQPVQGLYATRILTESGGITIKAALDSKVEKVQVKEIVTANKTLTAADSGKLLIINADGITITMPASSDFNIDIAKMDEEFVTIVQCAGADKFREGTDAISVIRDVSITNSGITGKEWLAIGAYEA